MSGDGFGYAIGAGLLVAGGGMLVAAAVVAATAAAAGYGVYKLTEGAGKMSVDLVNKRRASILLELQKEMNDMKMFSEQLENTEKELLIDLNAIHNDRKDSMEALEKLFNDNESDHYQDLSYFMNTVEKSNQAIVDSIRVQNKKVIDTYELNMKKQMDTFSKYLQEKTKHIETELDKIYFEQGKKRNEIFLQSQKAFSRACTLFEQLKISYEGVEDICGIKYKSIEETLAYVKSKLNEENLDSYEGILGVCNELPLKIVECMNLCDRRILESLCYINASEKMLGETETFLNSQKQVEYEHIYQENGEEKKCRYQCFLPSYMNGIYEEMQKQIISYREAIGKGYELVNEELVDLYSDICSLHSKAVIEVFNGIERIRNCFLRTDMQNTLITELCREGYTIDGQSEIESDVSKIAVRMLNEETGDVLQVIIREQECINCMGSKEIQNDIQILHSSDDPGAVETEERRLAVREHIAKAINENKTLQKSYGEAFECSIECRMDTYNKNVGGAGE